MTWQGIVVALVVLVAAAYLLRRAWRSLRGKAGTCGGCHCSKKPATPAGLIPTEQLILRRRDQTSS